MSDFPTPGRAQPRHRFVTFGLVMVVVGWLVLVADLLLSNAQLQPGSLVAVLALKSDIATLAQLLVLTGLGLALLGGLKEGFGALNRFFDAVLQRSLGARPVPMPEPDDADDPVVAVPHASERVHAAYAAHSGHGGHGGHGGHDRAPAPERPAAAGRNYTILPDGSVEVDTLLGTRIFASLDEARDFIR